MYGGAFSFVANACHEARRKQDESVAQLIRALAGLAARSLLGALIVYTGKLAERSL
jgi:mevalonate pyrophosphate decarboxylase